MIKCCSLYSGSSGNSIFIDSNETKILVDAGVSGKKIEEALNLVGTSLTEIDAILVSHEHSDHICSVGYLSKKYDIPVYASELTWNGMENQAVKIHPNNQVAFRPDNWINIGNLDILPFRIPHDANDPCGFSISKNNKKITIATDIGHINSYLIGNMESSDLLLIEANHDIEMLKCGKYPWPLKQRILGANGHLCNEIAGKTVAHLVKSGMKKFILGHLSAQNNFPELAFQTVVNSLEEIGAIAGEDVFLEVAPRNHPSRILELV